MNSSIVLLNEFALATPLEQFQILPLSAQSYVSSLPLTSLEEARLFPQITESDEFVYLVGGSALFSKITSWSHHAWLDLYSAVPSYIYSSSSLTGTTANEWSSVNNGSDFDSAAFLSAPVSSLGFFSLLTLPISFLFAFLGSGFLSAYIIVISYSGVAINSILGFLFLPFSAVGSIIQLMGGGTLATPYSLATNESSNMFSSMASGLESILVQFSDFIQGLFVGQLIIGGIFTNFMLITIVGFIAIKLFMSFAVYETKLVPTRWQAVFEMIYGFVLTTVCEQVGSKKGEKYFPAFFTLFFVVLGANVIALFPYTFSITSQIIVTFTISFFAFSAINLVGFLNHGIYLFGMLLPKGCPWYIVPLIVPIETLSYVFRVVSLALRIFANILSGHIMLKIITVGIWFLFALGGVGVFIHGAALGVVVVINILECLVAVLQAVVFVILCGVYLNDCVEGGH